MTRLFSFVLTFALVAMAAAKEIRIGLIGLDTSHVTAFTKIINDPKAEGHWPMHGSRPPFAVAARISLQLRAH